MEEKKLDVNTIIGFVLLSAVLMWMMYSNMPTEQEIKEKEKTEKLKAEENNNTTISQAKEQETNATITNISDSLKVNSALGSFAPSSIVSNGITEIKNNLLTLKISNKGGYINEAIVTDFERLEKNSKQPVKIIKNNNAVFNLKLLTKDNKIFNTSELNFKPILSTENGNQVLTMRLNAVNNGYLEYKYVLKPNDYMLDFYIQSQGLENVLSQEPIQAKWQLKTYRNEKSVSYENRYTELVYEYENGKDNYLNAQSKNADDTANNVTYLAYKQHFFTSILLTDTPFKKVNILSENLVDNEETDTIFTKRFTSEFPLEVKNGNTNYAMQWYYGPAKYEILNAYNKNLDEIMPLGWGIFGWINRYVFIPVFSFITKFLPYGIAIIIFTILVRLVMSPITYKSYVSQAKMKVLRPEIQEINDKYKDNAMKKQQETMALYNKAGVNPMAGCLPALLQIPVFYALFQFFPSMFDLRQKSFLWADDLSSYDSIFKLPFHIPFYGDHVSLFPILASVAIFFYMKMTTGDQAMSTPPQEGMPDMGKIIKMMIYISPIMMLFFFNNYASGLSLYYFISNLITIGIMLVIKKYIINEDKIHAKIQVNKAKPKTESKFQRKMREMMEQAEAQQKNKKK